MAAVTGEEFRRRIMARVDPEMPLPDEFRALRIRLNLTLQDIADFMGASPSSVLRWESGYVPIEKYRPRWTMAWQLMQEVAEQQRIQQPA